MPILERVAEKGIGVVAARIVIDEKFEPAPDERVPRPRIGRQRDFVETLPAGEIRPTGTTGGSGSWNGAGRRHGIHVRDGHVVMTFDPRIPLPR